MGRALTNRRGRPRRPPRRPDGARDALALENLRLVEHAVGIVYGAGLRHHDFDDAVQVGRLALLRAASHWSEDSGVKFSTYATRCVLNALTNDRMEGGPIRVPRSMRGEAADDLRRRLRPGSIEQVVHRFGGDEERGELRLLDLLAWPGREPEDRPHPGLDDLCRALPPREAAVVRLRAEGLYHRQVGARLGISHESARQLWHSAVRRLRQAADGAGPAADD